MLDCKVDVDGLYVESPQKDGRWAKVCDFALMTAIAESYVLDEYDDMAQHKERVEVAIFDNDNVDEFVLRNVSGRGTDILDIGCGSGRSLSSKKGLQITDALEPCWKRFQAAKKQRGVGGSISPLVKIEWGMAEALPYADRRFDVVISMGSWHYLRSQLEGFIEVNRVLKPGGIFIFDVASGKNFPYGGIVMNADGLLSILAELGFGLVEFRPLGEHNLGRYSWSYTGLALEKRTDVDLQCMRKLQLVKYETLSGYTVNNFIKSRDAWLL